MVNRHEVLLLDLELPFLGSHVLMVPPSSHVEQWMLALIRLWAGDVMSFGRKLL